MKQKQIYILGVVCLCLFALSVIRFKSRPNLSSVPTPISLNETISDGDGIRPIEEVAAMRPSPLTPDQIKAWDKKDLAKRAMGLVTVQPPKDGQDSILNIELRFKRGCTPGDADAIELDLKAAPSNRLLATLEGMSQGTQAFSWDIPKDFFTTGIAKKQFKLKATSNPIQLGFYLCTHRGGSSCQNKTVRDLNDIFTEHLRKKPEAGKEERVIFYQYFLLDENGLSIFDKGRMGQQQFDDLKKFHRENQFQGQAVEEGIDKTQKNMTTLASLPVIFEKDTLILELPKYDPAVCAGAQAPPEKQKAKP